MSTIKNNITDMTQGNIMSHIFIFAIPLFISCFFQQLYNIVDIMIAGYQLGDNAVAAIGATSALYSLIVGLSVGLNNGFGIVVARVLGSKDTNRLKNTIALMLVFDICISVLFTFVSILFLKPMLSLLNTPDSIFNDAYLYALIIFIGILFNMFFNMQASILNAVGNSKLPLIFLIISTILNIVLDWIFIAIFHMGVGGAALATVFAQLVNVVLCFIQLTKKYPELSISLQDFVFDKAHALEVLMSGLSMGLMSMIFSIGSVVLQAAVNGLGEGIITAQTSSRRIIDICMQPLATLATANAIFVSQNYGAGKIDRIKESIKKTCLAASCWSVCALIIVYAFANPLIHYITGTTNEHIISNAVMNLKINMPFYTFLGVLLILRTSLQGLGRKVTPLISSSLELIIKIIATFIFVPIFGYAGACIAEPFSWVICVVFMASVFWSIRKEL